MEKNRTITALIEDCTAYLEQNRYTKHRVERYRSMWRNGICRYMKDNGIENRNRPVGEKFISQHDYAKLNCKVTHGNTRFQ